MQKQYKTFENTAVAIKSKTKLMLAKHYLISPNITIFTNFLCLVVVS